MRAPAELRFVLATRHDMRLGLHRLRLEGELTEIRAARSAVLARRGAGAVRRGRGGACPTRPWRCCDARTEGWAAGLRLAALSLAGHPDPERFAAEFSGSERTVAEYLLAEVLERQPRGGPAAAAADLDARAGERRARRPADRGLGRRTDPDRPGEGRRVRGLAGRRTSHGSGTTACSPICSS